MSLREYGTFEHMKFRGWLHEFAEMQRNFILNNLNSPSYSVYSAACELAHAVFVLYPQLREERYSE